MMMEVGKCARTEVSSIATSEAASKSFSYLSDEVAEGNHFEAVVLKKPLNADM
jgi:hypothetical protein